MQIYSYVVARDYGFAPNPFYGYCTLATCKPIIRRCSQIGDWVIGTGSRKMKREGHLVFFMEITETMSFTEYWNDTRFLLKRPDLKGSKKKSYGDNIYRLDSTRKQWLQKNSHHSKDDGTPNINNIVHDTQTDRVLVSNRFTYWGGADLIIPDALRIICKIGPGYKKYFPEELVANFIKWARSLPNQGYCGRPLDWPSTHNA